MGNIPHYFWITCDSKGWKSSSFSVFLSTFKEGKALKNHFWWFKEAEREHPNDLSWEIVVRFDRKNPESRFIHEKCDGDERLEKGIVKSNFG